MNGKWKHTLKTKTSNYERQKAFVIPIYKTKPDNKKKTKRATKGEETTNRNQVVTTKHPWPRLEFDMVDLGTYEDAGYVYTRLDKFGSDTKLVRIDFAITL